VTVVTDIERLAGLMRHLGYDQDADRLIAGSATVNDALGTVWSGYYSTTATGFMGRRYPEDVLAEKRQVAAEHRAVLVEFDPKAPDTMRREVERARSTERRAA
jgi:hypothetical protein